jgi:hypothetical protein
MRNSKSTVMKAKHIQDTSGLMKFAGMSQSAKNELWDFILCYKLSVARLKSLSEMRHLISQMVDDGATFSMATSVSKKTEIEGLIVGETATANSFKERIEDTMTNNGLSKECEKLFEAINGNL